MYLKGSGSDTCIFTFRIMETFAAEYVRQNPDVFETEPIYLLSFAIIMLNTDIHHSPQPVKMTREQFIQMVMSSTTVFPQGLLGLIYDRVVATALL